MRGRNFGPECQVEAEEGQDNNDQFDLRTFRAAFIVGRIKRGQEHLVSRRPEYDFKKMKTNSSWKRRWITR